MLKPPFKPTCVFESDSAGLVSLLRDVLWTNASRWSCDASPVFPVPRWRAARRERRPAPAGPEEQTAGGSSSGGLSQRAEPSRRQQVSATAQREVGQDEL